MKKVFTLLAVLAVLLMASCSPESDKPQSFSITPDADRPQTLAISSIDTITLEGLEDGQLYGVNVNSSEGNTRSSAPGFIKTAGGTQLILSDGSDVSFSGADLGITGSGSITIIKYQPVEDDWIIDTENDEPLYTYEGKDGKPVDVFEEYYLIDLEEMAARGFDRTQVVHLRYQDGWGRYTAGCGIIDPQSSSIFSYRFRGVADLSDPAYDKIGVFNQVIAFQGESTQEIVIQNPIKLACNQTNSLQPLHQIYQVPVSECALGAEMVLELDIGSNPVYSYWCSGVVIESRYAYGENVGRRKRNVFPISYEDDHKLILYVGEVEEDFIFDINMYDNVVEPGTITLREITSEEKESINYIDLTKMEDGYLRETITSSSDSFFTPIIFLGDNPTLHPGLEICATGPYEEGGLRVVSSNQAGGHNNHPMSSGVPFSRPQSNMVLEHAVFRNWDYKQSEIIIELKDKGFEDVFRHEISPTCDPTTLSVLSSDIVRLENLEGGHLYGINVPGTGVDFDCRVPGLIQTRGGTYLLLSDGADFTFLASDLGVYGSSEITIVEYQITDEDMVINTLEDAPLYDFIDDKGRHCQVYEELYALNLKELEESGFDLTQFALFDHMYQVGEGGKPSGFLTDFGIVNPCQLGDFNNLDMTGILDLSDYGLDEIYIFSQIVKQYEADRHYEVVIQNPLIVGTDDIGTDLLPHKGLYQVQADDCTGKEMVLELDIGENWIGNFEFLYNTINSRIAYDDNGKRGKRQPYVFPISYDEMTGKVVIYVGEVEEDFIFEIYRSERPGTLKLRQITDEEKALINVINLPDMKDGYLKVSLDINEDTYFCPIIFQGDSSKYSGLQLKCSYSDSSFGGRVVFGWESRYMFSQWSLSNGRVLDNGDGHALEHAVIRNGSWMNGQVVIELSTNGFPDGF